MINLSELLDRAKKKALEKPDNKDGYAPKSTDELRFKRKHVVNTTPDANKNGDDVFKGTSVKAVDRAGTRFGYNPGQDEEVYEEVKKKKVCKECGKKYTGKQCSCCMNEAKTRMPLDGHPYHNKSDAELKYIIKDAGEAAQAMRGQDSKAENKYLDQVNDASTILAYRQKLQKNSYEPDGEHISEMQWNYGKKREPSPNPHPDHEFNKLSDKELKNIIDTHNQTYPERNDYDPTGNRPSRKTPLGSNWSYMSDRDKQKEIKQNPKIQEYLKSAKNFPIAKEILRWRDGQVNESAAPGKEDWIKANKQRFIKQYGKEKGLKILYAKAWAMSKGK